MSQWRTRLFRLENKVLPDKAQQKRDAYQKEVNKLSDYAQKVNEAKRLFGTRNRPNNKTFQFVRALLEQMCSGGLLLL